MKGWWEGEKKLEGGPDNFLLQEKKKERNLTIDETVCNFQ